MKVVKKTKNNSPWLVFLCGLLVGGIIWCVLFVFVLGDLKTVSSQLDDFSPPLTTRIYDIEGRLLAELFTENREYVELSQIPDIIKKAFIASEDQNFYHHPGIDPGGIARAAWQNLINMDIVEGASTITQQLSRNLFLSHHRTWKRKIQEIFLAFTLEKKYTKNEILEAYLNQIYFGHGAYGIKAAAQIYFGKNLEDLNLAEIAMLAGVARSPGNFSPYVDLSAAQRQQRRVLRRMKEAGFISKEELEEALATPIVLSGREKNRSPAPYFVDYLIKELQKSYNEETIFGGGLKIYTTIDLDIQKVADQALKDSGYQGAILCIEPQTGYIKAMVGGRDYDESKFNRAVQAYRQPGSAFKPFIYSAALDSGFTPSTILVDEPLVFPNGWKPQNYEKTFNGPITLREALEKSVNIIGIKLLQETGVDKVINYARKMGIKSDLRRDLSLALGTSEVNLLELTNAYCAFANRGLVPEPIAILRIENFSGETLYESQRTLRRALSEDTAYIMARLLQGVIERGTAKAARIDRPAGGKTGTTEDFIDAWFVGFTPDLVCGIYLGNDDRTPLGPRKTGGVIAAPLFSQVMKEAHQDIPVHDFTPPPGIREVKVCMRSGKLASSNCSAVTLPFKAGTEPREWCSE
ncbi:MAG TPA: penicillin-binding protein 1A [Candidatus Atribacteria bacterium]|nr:penicillin-binding protein 1A [Candidatus Atribacteria bacterium]